MATGDRVGVEVAVNRFVEEVGSLLAGVDGSTDDVSRREALDEVFELVAAVIDADRLATDPELVALREVFGPRAHELGGPAAITLQGTSSPADLRAERVVTGRRSWLGRPSARFDRLATADADGGSRARTYYERAMAVAYLVASLDARPSREELAAIERFRGALLARIRNAGSATPSTTGPEGLDVLRAEGSPEDAQTGPGDADDLAPPRPLEELYAELDALIGLESVKEEVRLVAAFLEVQQLRAERGLATLDSSRHLVFTGNPGTGKTTVARLLGEIYRTLGVVTGGQLVEVDRAGLVAGYVGQTATKVTEVFDTADGGVLLIDEAYALLRGSEQDFGREAIDTIVKLAEDRRDRVVVILAGYPAEMEALVSANPGLRSRFGRTIEFPDYTDEELLAIFVSLCDRFHYVAPDEVRAAVAEHLAHTARGPGFGNGRLVRNLFEAAVDRHARRVVERDGTDGPSDLELVTLSVEDVVPATS